MSNRRPAWARWVTRGSLVIAIAALVYTVNDIGLDTLCRFLVKIGWFWIMVVVMEAFITCCDATALRAFTVPEPGEPRIRLRHTLLAQLAGRAINAVTPTGNLGEVVKMSVLTEHVSPSRAVSTVLLYNIVRFVVELGFVALAAPFFALLMPMPSGLRAVVLVSGVACLAISVGLWLLVRRGMLASLTNAAVKLRLVSPARRVRWDAKLRGIDEKLQVVIDGPPRDRWLGIAAIVVSHTTSMALSLLILVAIGESLTIGFVAAYIVGGFLIYNVAMFVPMGIGVSEGGWYGLLQALGESPARVVAGVTMVIARRVTTVIYAAIGLVLLTASETVKRARAKQAAPAPEPLLAVADDPH